MLTSDFLRKYVIFARRRYAKEGVQIDIQDEAAERIVEFYGALRRKSHHERWGGTPFEGKQEKGHIPSPLSCTLWPLSTFSQDPDVLRRRSSPRVSNSPSEPSP